jgi:uncharacterized protein YhaN
MTEWLSLLESQISALQEELAVVENDRVQLARLERREQEQREALAQAQAEFAAWTQRWAGAMVKLGRAVASSPEEVEVYLSGLSLLSNKASETKEMRRRVDGISRDTQAFSELFESLARAHAPDLLGGDLIEGAETLLARAREAGDVQRERVRLRREISERQARLTQAGQRLAAAEAELSDLTAEAGVATPHELAPALQRSARKRELLRQLSSLKEVLRSRSGGRSLEELVKEVEGLDHDELRASILSLEGRQEELDTELRLAQKDAVELGRGLSSYSSEDAALARQRLAERRAVVVFELRDYLTRRAAWMMLRAEVERYAAENQGPILERATAHFSRLTLGRYRGLRVGLGEQTLWCVREGKDVEVEGLSRGTRAQLYLALRIASLERHFDSHGSVPLLLDDLFVDFDDDRTAAAFEVLGDLSEKTQILYYTHLARDVEAADAAVPKGRLFLHKLGVA